MRHLVILILLQIGTRSAPVWSQKINIDSLRSIVERPVEDTHTVVACRILAGSLRNSDPRLAMNYGMLGARAGIRLGFDRGVAGCYLNLAAIYSTLQRLDSAMLYIDTAIYWSKRAGEDSRLALAYLNRADFNMQTRNLRQALLDCDTALDYAERADAADRIARIRQTIGSVYYLQGNYEESRHYYERANSMYLQLKNYSMSAIVLNNIGNVFKRTLKYDSAIHYYQRAIHIADSIGETMSLAMYFGNLSDVYVSQQRWDVAAVAARKSLDYALEKDMPVQQAIAYTYLGQVYLGKKEFSNAIAAGLQALTLAENVDDMEIKRNAADILAEAYAGSGNHARAYSYLQLASRWNDTLNSQKYDEEIATLQTSFKVEEKNQEIRLLNKERELSSQKLSRQRIILWASAGLVALAMITIWLLAGRSRMKQRMKEMSVRQQIAADLHDEVGSSLSSIHMLSQMAEGNGSNRAEIMKRVTEYTRETMDKMGDILWMIKPTETEWTGLKERMQKFLSEICEARQMSCSFQWLEGVKATLNMKQRKGLYLVFKEAVNNAAKYSKAGNVKVSVDYKSNRVILQVNDNGVGFDPLLNSAGNGLGNMKRRASELGGETVIESMPGKGTRIVFSFPA